MSIANVKPKTPISAFDPDYWKLNQENTKKAEEILKVVFPDVWEIRRLMKEFSIDYRPMIEFLYCVRTVKRHGYGSVVTNIMEGQITKMEGLIRTIFKKEVEVKKF